ncbi:hypothetical protein [Chishuiella changwenlii]|uniref:hypothetical protein n=1 Tax=Chishuiella changwenlii TaxID=1434701 RepID=UPI002FDAE4E0
MSDLDPIELGIAVNSEEVIADFNKLMASSGQLDKSVAQAKTSFNDFVQAQLAGKGVLNENANLTEAQSNAIKRHAEALVWLKEQLETTFDPTQIKVYEYQISQAESAIDKIIQTANQRVELLDTAQIEQTNAKLEEAGKLIDQISDTTFSPSFATPEELEVLSTHLNKTDDELEQLGTVIDFVSAKLNDLDPNSEEFAKLSADIETANEMLGRTPAIYDAAGNSIDQMNDALKAFQAQLAEETDPEKIQILNQNIETLEDSIKALKNAGRSGFDEFGNKITEQKETVVQLQTELENLIQEMGRLRLANQENSKEYTVLKERATEIRTALNKVNQEVNASASASASLDTLIRATTAISAGFSMAQGAAALFGSENENVERTIAKVTATMAILQGLQQIQLELKRADSIVTVAQTTAQKAYTMVVGTSTGALKLFRIALASTGIGLIVILLASLIANWDKVTASIKNSFPALNGFGDQIDKIKAYVMGFLNAYLEMYKTIWNTLMKLKNADFSGAWGEIKNAGGNISDAFNNGKQDSLNASRQEKQNKILQKAIEEDMRKIEVIEARTGEKQYTRRAKNIKAQLSLVEKGSEEEIKLKQDLNLLYADQEKKQTDEAKKAHDKRQKEAEAAARKAKELAEKLYEARKKIQEKINALEDNLNNRENEGNEIAQIKKKYDTIRKEAQKVGLGQKDLIRIDVLETKEIQIKTYENETKDLLKNLNEQKDLFAAYEALKTKIGETEAKKRYDIAQKEFGTFSDVLEAEIKKLTNIQNRSFEQNERLNSLQTLKTDVDKGNNQKQIDEFAEAYQATISHREKLQRINELYDGKALTLQKTTDEKLRAEHLQENEKLRQDVINSANAEIYEKTTIYERMSQSLIGITKRELAIRIQTLDEYLKKLDSSLTDEQKAFIESEKKKAKTLLKSSELSLYENSLLQEKERLLALIAKRPKGLPIDPAEIQRLEEINQELRKTAGYKALMVSEKAAQLAGGFKDMASAIGDSNEGLSSTLETIGDILDVASNAATAFASFSSGDIVGGIASTMKTIAGVLSIGKKARESERKAREEIKKYQAEMIASQLEYNKTLRDRLLTEASINDLYVSRVQNIKEEMDALKKNKESIIRDQQSIFDRLLNSETITGKSTKKKGGVFGIGRKTVVIDEKSTISKILGLKEGAQLTDDIFERLERLNAQKPLTGDAKDAYEQLKKLRDEYGSIDDAMKQLEIDLKNALTGTTAQSIADSIIEGLKSGKRSFADFANDVEGFLRDAMIAGMSAKVLEPEMQKLQDALAEMMGDGVLTEDERKQFQEMYMKLAQDAQQYMDILNQTGINMSGTVSNANSLKGAIQGMTADQADLLAGQFGGLRLVQLETNKILQSGAAQQLASSSRMIEQLGQIEINTRQTATNTEMSVSELRKIKDLLTKMANDNGRSGGIV